MSLFSEKSTISAYDAKESKADEGQVLLVSKSSKRSGKTAICTSVAPISNDDVLNQFEALLPHVQSMIHAERIKLLRANESRGFVLESDVNLSSVISSLDAQSRLTKQAIEDFLREENNKETLRACFAGKFKYSSPLTREQEQKLNAATDKLISTVLDLASGKVVWEDTKQVAVKSYLELLEDSPVKDKLIGRIDHMNDVDRSDDLMETLGF